MYKINILKMYKNFYKLFVIVSLVLSSSAAHALNRPTAESDVSSLSYVFYLYYDNGQLFADRDHDIKYDVLNEKFIAPTSSPANYKGAIITFKSVTAQTFEFDPRQGNSNFKTGKIEVRAPYVPDAQQATFYDTQGKPILNVFVNAASVCNDDGICTAAEGESIANCTNDCKQARTSPITQLVPVLDEGYDLNTILIYAIGGLVVAFGVWFGWRWLKKKREESFLPTPSSNPPVPPVPPVLPGSSSME